MDVFSIFNKSKKNFRYPRQLFDRLESKSYTCPPAQSNEHDGWVTARFSPHQSLENVIYLGDDPGNIGIFNVDKLDDQNIPLEEKQLHFFAAHDGAIMDIIGVPNKQSSIVSISGDSTIRCWDLNHTEQNRTSELFYGHDGSVRSICFAPDDSNVFATGSRDGQIKVWDMRVSVCRRQERECRNSTITYKSAHLVQPEKASTPKGKSKVKTIGSSVTSVVFLNDYTISSASSNAETGIRLWDIRKPTHNGEGHPAVTLNVPITKQRKAGFGVTCLAVDRFRNSLFASCTNSVIFEYSVTTSNTSPVRAYNGSIIRDYYTQLACSPISDTIACGSDDNRALIWDVQDQYEYINDSVIPDEITKRRGLLPKWSFGGHDSKVLCVGWSSNAKYFMTLDEKGLRLWNEKKEPEKWACCDDDISYDTLSSAGNSGLSFEKVELFEMSKSDDTMTKIDSMSLVPRQRQNSGMYRSPQKPRVNKRPLTSPFKSVASSPQNLSLSPRAKMGKYMSYSPGKSPLLSSTSINSITQSAKGYCTPKETNKRLKPFFNRFPTGNLPNFVYDRFVRKIIGKTEHEPVVLTELSKTSRKRIDDWWQNTAKSNENSGTKMRLPSVSEFGESACSKVIPEEQRNALLSPRKLIVKNSSATKKARTPKSASVAPKTPVSNRRTSRNLLHYFNKQSD